MVLGLINFLLGGKKTSKVPKNAQASTPMSNVGGNVSGQVQENTNVIVTQNNQPNQNEQKLEFKDSNQKNTTQQAQTQSVQNIGGKKSISDILNKINKEMKSTSENVTNILTDIKDLKESVNSIEQRVVSLEKDNESFNTKMTDVDENMGKFLSLYEIVNNQYNPFVTNNEQKEIILENNGTNSENISQEDLKDKIKKINITNPSLEKENLKKSNNSLLELDTLDIEEAAGNAIPLTSLKTNTNSLVIILSWLEYLVKKVGVEESKNTLRYYTETLKWITPEVYFELDKFLKGMNNKELNIGSDKILTVKDHIVSLYFISKLNEKKLDEKLTKAVLEIIDEA